jgi:hypothetical protein
VCHRGSACILTSRRRPGMSVVFVPEESAEASQEVALRERQISTHSRFVAQSGFHALEQAVAYSSREALRAAQLVRRVARLAHRTLRREPVALPPCGAGGHEQAYLLAPLSRSDGRDVCARDRAAAGRSGSSVAGRHPPARETDRCALRMRLGGDDAARFRAAPGRESAGLSTALRRLKARMR